MLRKATRLEKIPPYLFMELRNKINKAKAAGVDVISLAIGDPVESTPGPIIEELCRAAHDPANHRYPTDEEKGMAALRREVCRWYAERYAAPVDPETECLILIGSKEGGHHFALAMVNPGDTVLLTDPGYPGYRPSIWLAGAEPYPVPMTAENGFLPDLRKIPADVVRKAKAFYLNYPNNPTGAVATPEFLTQLVAFAREHSIAICYDNPYIDIVFDGARPLSILSIAGAKDVAVELNSFSKPFNMCGWRLGMALGNPTAIAAMAQVKSNTDSGVFNAVQYAGIAALRHCKPEVEKMLRRLRAAAQAGGGHAQLHRLEVRAAEGNFLSLAADAGRQEFGGFRGAAFREGSHRRRARQRVREIRRRVHPAFAHDHRRSPGTGDGSSQESIWLKSSGDWPPARAISATRCSTWSIRRTASAAGRARLSPTVPAFARPAGPRCRESAGGSARTAAMNSDRTPAARAPAAVAPGTRGSTSAAPPPCAGMKTSPARWSGS